MLWYGECLWFALKGVESPNEEQHAFSKHIHPQSVVDKKLSGPHHEKKKQPWLEMLWVNCPAWK